MANISDGVEIKGAPSNTNGGSVPGTRNIIAANLHNGVHIGGDQAIGNNVYGNYIGLNVSGDALGNKEDGVLIEMKAARNHIGVSGDGGRNIISGNLANGVEIGDDMTTGNSVINNYIGTDVTGMSAKENHEDGIFIDDAPGNFIGDSNEQTMRLVQGNLIAGNGADGVHISGATASGNRIRGNFIGTNLNTTADVANGINGVFIDAAPNNVIGSSNDESTDYRNVISGNSQNGVFINGMGASGTFIQGNYIGTDISGKAPFGNVLGNLADGVLIMNAPNTTISGRNTVPDAIISGNASNGVEIIGEEAKG